MKKVYTKDVSIYKDPEVFRHDYDLMPLYRKEKIDRFRFDESRYLSLGVGILLRQALNELGIKNDPEIILSKNGKPMFKDIPDLYYSLSHSGERAMCVISDTPVGCDVQIHEKSEPRNDKVLKSIVDKYFAEDEKDLPFYDVWALKESYMKATGTGLIDDMKSVPIHNNTEYSFELLDIEPGYSYAVCYAKNSYNAARRN